MADFTKKETNKSMMRPTPKKKWKPPPEDMYKINIDGAFKSATREDGVFLFGIVWEFFWRVVVVTYVEWQLHFKPKLLQPSIVWKEQHFWV